jgi:single-strand DNA-binding protein
VYQLSPAVTALPRADPPSRGDQDATTIRHPRLDCAQRRGRAGYHDRVIAIGAGPALGAAVGRAMNGIGCAFQGRVSRDGELKHTQGGTPMLTFSVVVHDAKTTEDAPPELVRVVAWGELAESLAGRLVRGTECYVEGRVKLSEWTDRDGAHRCGLNVSARVVQPMGQIGRWPPGPAGRGRGAGAPEAGGLPEG